MRPATVVVVNHNYGRFLRAAIDSALAQTHRDTEVVVVDDGSTDASREVISAYGNDVRPVFKENGGQASAWSASLVEAAGAGICFLDADDVLDPTALERALPLLEKRDVVKVHWPLRQIDALGRPTGELTPGEDLPEGDLRELVLDHGPHSYETPPASGKLWSRRFLERVLPLPRSAERAHGVDVYLSTIAPLYGRLERLREPLGCYRVHGQNNWASMSFDERASFDLAAHDLHCDALAEHSRRLGLEVDAERWKRESWLRRRWEATEEIAALVPAGERFVLMDEGEWGMDQTAGRRAIPFLERAGSYWGPPPDDPTAIRELERLRREGAQRVVVGWPAFWWLDHYPAMHRYLRSKGEPVCRNERVAIFHLGS